MEDLKIRLGPPSSLPEGQKTRHRTSTGFGEVIKRAIRSVERMEKTADRSVAQLLQGKVPVHETMIALQKANISMRLLLAVRNKVIESYREIMHMQF